MNPQALTAQGITDVFSIRGSQFAAQIEKTLNTQSQKEALFSFLLYSNLLAFITVLLALYGLPFTTTAILIFVGYGVLTLNLVLIKVYGQKQKISIWLNSIRSFIYDGILTTAFLSILINATSIPPLIAILTILISSLASLAFSSRSIETFFISKGILFSVAAIYGVVANDGSYSAISIVFPIIIAYTLLSTMAYWLHLRQIRQVHSQLQQQYLHEQLKKEQELRKRLFLYVGHDLRQPINALGMLLHAVPEQNEMIEDAKQCVRSSKRLIDDIVQIATYQGENIALNISEFSLHKLLKNIEQEYSGDALDKGCELHVVDCSLRINNDFQLVSRIVKNFVSNAITHASGSKILVGVRRRKDAVEIQVLDQGPGIADREQEIIFNEFSQGENGNKEIGFGLGLTIAKHFANVCEGSIIFKSKAGQGTLIGLRLALIEI